MFGWPSDAWGDSVALAGGMDVVVVVDDLMVSTCTRGGPGFGTVAWHVIWWVMPV